MKRSKLIVGSLLLTSLAMGQESDVTQDDANTTEQAEEIDTEEVEDSAEEVEDSAEEVEENTEEAEANIDTSSTVAPSTDDKPEKITVTGSRIARIDLEGAQSITRFTRDDLDNSSFVTVSDFIQNSIPSGAFTNENFGLSQTAGSSSFGGRGAAASYTLVLVNGRRMPTNAIADSFVDLNLIPLAAVESIEYLTDGASAIYGSDAVAGVLNIMLKKTYDGTNVRTRFGIAEEGDADTTNVQIVSGTSDDKSSSIFTYDYFRREPINAINRPLINTAVSPDGQNDNRSPNGLPGYVIFDDGTQQAFDDCPPGDVGVRGGQSCAYDYAPLYQVIPQTERHSFYSHYTQDLSSDLSLFAEARYSRVYTKIANGAAPGGVNLAASAPDNPYGEDVFLIRRYIDFGPRLTDNINTVFSLASGLSGYIGDTWNWNFTYTNHKLRNTQVGAAGNIDSEKASQYFNDGTLNPFAFNDFNTDDLRRVRDDIATETFREGTSKLETYNLDFAGELPVMLSGGPIAMATGLEYRDEGFEDRSDSLSQITEPTPRILGSAGGTAGGDRDNKAVYVEVGLPILPNWDTSLAARYDIIDNNKDATTYALNTSFKPIDQLLLRGSYSTGFKAPDLHQVYLASSFGVATTIDQKLCDEQGLCENIEVNTVSSGNEDLEPEKSIYWNLGAVYEATKDLTFRFDYWRLDIKDRVGALSADFILQNEAQYQDLVQRANGFLNQPGSQVLTPLDNISETRSAGIEAGFTLVNRTEFGQFTTDLLLNRITLNEFPTGPGEPLCDYADRQKDVDANLRTRWAKDKWGANIAVRYFGAYTTYDGDPIAGGCDLSPDVESTAFDVDPNVAIDLGATYVINNMFDVGVGIQNLLNEDPAYDGNGFFSANGDARGWPYYDQQRYSNIGRFYYVGLNANLN